MAIIAYLYFEKEIKQQQRLCKKDLQNGIIQVESDLLKAKLTQVPFHFQPKKYSLRVGLFDANKKLLFSSLRYPNVDFSKMMVKTPTYIHYVHPLQIALFDIHYIVTEDTSMPISKERLLSLIMIVILFASIFIAFIGYLLSRLLLKPVKMKISQIDRFIKDSAHEINTPITSLLMSVSALKKKGGADKKILNHISISSKQISEIYNALSHLAFDNIKRKKDIIPINLKTIVEKSVEFYQEIAKANGMQIHTALEDFAIMIDPQDAKKLLNNLLSNAVKYNKKGGNITVRLQKKKLYIQDEGIGIEEKDKKRILKRYHRASSRHGGFGIGLDIVNAVAKEYNIGLEIASKKGKGSTFILDFSAIV